MPNLQIMILHNQLHKPIQRLPALLFRQPIDLLHMMTDRKYRVPSRHRIRPNDRMNGRQVFAYVLRSTARLTVDLEPVFFGAGVEAWLRVCRG